MLAITTFPPGHWDYYAKLCVERMVKLWPGPVRVYFEGAAPPVLEGIEARPLDSLERTDFLNLDLGKPSGINSFLWDAKRFCHKVFAQLDAMEDGEPFWWIDADVAIFNQVPERLLEQEDFVTFMGRDSYTETGLIGFNPEHPEFKWFAERYRAQYVDRELLRQQYWTDCHAFDAARSGRGHNLTPNGKGFSNVMESSEFGAYMAHFKGPRKAELYRLGGADAVSANL